MPPEDPPKSFGNISDDHWTRTRAGMNQEALDYMRERSRAPGVESGGAERNFYCMECDGVVDYDHAAPNCPHCGAVLEGKARRYFNWVEIDQPAESDLRALLPWLLGALLLISVLFFLLLRWLL
jgi:hypothetical protein